MMNKPTILITGATGMLGSVLSPILAKDFNLLTPAHRDLDITKADTLALFLQQKAPDIVVHLASITDLELCERDHELADLVNVNGTKNIIQALPRESVFLFLSTGAVYTPVNKLTNGFTENDPCESPNYYGVTKLKAEAFVRAHPNHYILRTNWLYGGPQDKKFLSKILPNVQNGERVSIVDDVYGSPTSTFDLSYMIKDILAKNAPFGIYNAVNSGSGSRLDMIMHAATTLGLDTTIIKPISSDMFPQTLTRHQYAILNNEKFSHTLYRPREWQEALADYLLTYYSQD
ncbi:NAD(P)-dependent oxidoreductase [candidate division WWE3 bacterium]|uniref:dTDP-4-dehydrorhamnose reductase n=1 Tax=candidate division WWE3 bacterium TaxID=2053526 RepID=A0A955RPR7_UNCKA|nr:NAD(P)-dependent oxidoreductase [candidate division WWE3 bacterium]